MAGGAVVAGRWGLSGSLADRPVTAHTAVGLRVKGRVLITQVKSRSPHDTELLGGRPFVVSRSGTVRQVRPIPAPRHFPRLEAGPRLPRHSSGSSALKPVSSAACRKAGEALLTRNATPASVTA